MTGLSLFTGIGGMDLAFEAAGGRVIAMCERDEFCKSVLNRHWPNIPVYNDVKTLRGEEIGTVDIIYGGFPCQPYSVCGQRKSKDDARHLWPECARLVKEIRPGWCVFENVPGILSLVADEICQDLERQNYSVGIFNYEAAAVGAAHRRARVFFVAHSRCSLQSRSAIPGTFCGEYGSGKAPDLERSSGAFVGDSKSKRRNHRCDCEAIRPSTGENNSSCGTSPLVSDTESGGRHKGAANKKGRGKRGESRTWDRPADVYAVVSNSNSSWGLQQEGQLREVRERTGDICETTTVSNAHGKRLQKQLPAITAHGERASFRPTERCSRRGAESELGGMAHGFPAWLDGAWWRHEPNISRTVPRGFPRRVSRLKALGNAVVPAQIYPIFVAIAAIYNNDDWRGES